MNSQELLIQVWREKFMTEANQCATAWVEVGLLREQVGMLQKELDALKAASAKKKPKGAPQNAA